MRAFISGVVLTLIVLACAIWAVSRLGLYPIGADNPPSGLERSLAGRAMDVYADRHKPEMQNPTPLTADNLTEGAKDTRSTARSATAVRRRRTVRCSTSSTHRRLS